MTDLLRLPNLSFVKLSEEDRDVIIEAKSKQTRLPPPCCLLRSLKKNGTKAQRYRDHPLQAQTAWIEIKRQRFRCAECGATHYETLPDIDPDRRLTTRFRDHLGRSAVQYSLATTFHECDRKMQPIEEYGRGKGRSYGPTGFWGRGFVQLTWEANYRKATLRLRALGILRADEDLVKTPKLAMRLDVAAAILFYGMIEGWFTGKTLADYFGGGRYDAVGARRIINGTDDAALIAGYCGRFVDALRAAGHSVIPSTAGPKSAGELPSPSTSTAKTSTQPALTGGLSSAPAPTSGFWSRVHTFLSRKAV